ncbi:MAG TPA: hypothetical protein DCO79_09465 [Spirochaeta sp.]|nr:hypothetical protein [Spirochaeta sp.]
MLIKKVLIIGVLLIILVLAPVTAQGKETLAVLDFTTEAVSEVEMSAIVEFLSAELFRTDKYVVIDVSQRETILQEMEFSMQGCTDDSCALEIGKMLSAEMIVTGNLSKVGSRYLMSVKMLETETSRTMGTANGKYRDLDELIDGLELIAYTLADMEHEVETVAEKPTPEAEPEPVVEPEVETAKKLPVDDRSPVEAAKESAAEKKAEEAASDSDFNFLSFGVSAAGSVAYTASGILRSVAFVNRLAAEEAYDNYMTTVDDPGYLFSGDGDGDYEHLFSNYEGALVGSYANSGAAALASGTSFFLGDSYMSFGGKLTYGLSALAFAAGNVLSTMSCNNAIDSLNSYNDYMSAGSSSAEELWNNYESYHNSYQILQYSSYGLWGAGGLMAIASWFIPGEKTEVTPGLLPKIIITVGQFFLAGGNFTGTMAVNSRFSAEDAFDEYMSAGETAAANLFDTYQNYQDTYELMTYMSYGLWGAGAAAILTAMLLPVDSGADVAADFNNFSIRPALTGFGVEVDIKVK